MEKEYSYESKDKGNGCETCGYDLYSNIHSDNYKSRRYSCQLI